MRDEGRPILNSQKSISSPVLTNKAGGAGKWSTANLNNYFSATGCSIDLKPSCIFKFGYHLLQDYVNKGVTVPK